MRAADARSSISRSAASRWIRRRRWRRHVLEAARRGRARGGTGSRRSPARRSARRARRRGGRTLRLGQPGQRDELVGVERRSDHRHPLQHFARRRRDAADHVGVERLHPLRLVSGGPAGAARCRHRERDAAARAPRSARSARPSVRRRGGGRAPRSSSSSSGPSSSSVAPWRSIRLRRVAASVLVHRRRPVREHDAHALVARRPGDVVHEAQAGVVGVVHVVDREQQAVASPTRGGPARPRRRTAAGASCRRSTDLGCRRARGRSPRGGGRARPSSNVGCRRHTSASASTTGAYGHAPSTGADVPVPDPEAQLPWPGP